MKASELRIGNWVLQEPKNARVETIIDAYDLGNLQFYPDKYGCEYEPIPLTEEWLERFGFQSYAYQDMYILGWLKINCDKTRGKLELWVENIIGNVVYLQYVHQLQNLYFALTGEELHLSD